jgi:beta-aspartyl-dipeptidase (metallo-type)
VSGLTAGGVVGCLGVDTTMKTPAGLLGRVKGLRHEGVNVWMWTGGYNVPPTTITDSVRNDIMFLAEVIGCGEVAISDERATDPDPRELARLVHDAHVGGMLSGKVGLTHVHVGEGERRLRCIREVLDPQRFQVQAEWLYLTHVQRNEALLAEALELAHEGVAVDFDVAAHDLAADLVVLDRESLEPRSVIAGGRHLMRDGRAEVVESFLEESDRRVLLEGRKDSGG